MTNYAKLHQISKNAAVLNAVQQLLDWDQETYMPSDAIGLRSLQNELLASLVHKQRTGPAFAKALAKLVDLSSGALLDTSLSPPQIAAVREWRRDYLQDKKLPASFVKTFAKTTSNATHAWAKAKKSGKFREFSPFLEKIVKLCRKKADLLGYKDHPYDALLDIYEPDMTVSYLNPLFDRLKTSLTQLLKAISARPAPDQSFLYGNDSFSKEKQLEFSHVLLKAMGFDPKTSRLDQTMHPFCAMLHPTDTRMTTHLDTNYVMSNIFSVIHEGGHGLYGLGFKEENFGSPLAQSISLGYDESQSRLWETRIGRSLSFWQHFLPLLKQVFPEKLSAVSLDAFYRAINLVKASLIRVEADEVTYSLHVIVRFEIEKALLEGSLRVKDLPEVWNAKMQEYLGVVPKTNSEGCLQDIHWAMGGLGYFPTYTLGNLYASQIFATFEKSHTDWQAKVAKGELGFIREWLHQNIHQYGKQYTAAEMIMRISGQPLSEKPFVAYLEHKYKHLYSL